VRSQTENGRVVYCVSEPMTAHHEEIEIKLRVPDAAALRSRLKRLRTREITPRTYESNTLYDTPEQYLRRRGKLIRIRVEIRAANLSKKRPSENTPALLTYKGPSHLSRSARKAAKNCRIHSPFKINDEAEVWIADAPEMARILQSLGFYPAFRYEKFRTTYALPGIRGLNIELDETPVGIYLELEGPVAAINRGARLLGYARQDYLKETYGSLISGRVPPSWPQTGRHALPANKKIAITRTLSLTKFSTAFT
jgi:adenylate cyclase class 2